ncbi:MAG: hypothetical protein K2W96_06345 [Gemmataceae bacterium]|nr:hypothetical protein [Gemmataceae bacterium]
MIPPEADAAFAANMEGVLDAYARPHYPARPLVAVDEGGKQLVGDVREPFACAARLTSEAGPRVPAQRHGEPALAVEPLSGWRHAEVAERKTAAGFAKFLRRASGTRRPSGSCWCATT